MGETIRWGIIGLGNIAHKFAHDIQLAKDAVLHGVASRDPLRSKQFFEKYQAYFYYDSYDDLLADPKIDIVYIATTNNLHFEHTLRCLRAGKAVLCEKPFALNAQQVRQMIAEAQQRNLFLMEGMWSRFLPATIQLLDLIASGAIGAVNFIQADFGTASSPEKKARLFQNELGGGSLLDIGIYPLYLSLLLLGKPKKISANATMTPEAVDGTCSMLLGFKNEETAVLSSSIRHATPTEARIYGSKGFIHLQKPFHYTRKLTLTIYDEEPQVFEPDFEGFGYYHEITSINDCLRKGETENPLMTHHHSLELIEMLDIVRELIGLSFEADQTDQS